jgi:arylsulfatase A-like enzyme
MSLNPVTRRNLLASATALAAGAAGQSQTGNGKRPNILIVISDQFRADNLGCLGNPMNLTPNLDGMARRGVVFRQAMTNQPVCAPARAILFTGRYPQQNGVWRNGLGLRPGDATLATLLTQQGYSANYIGKWHLAPNAQQGGGNGAVPPQFRGGFTGLWEGANALELVSHPFEGEMYDNDGKPLRFSNQYRADFLTDRAVRFLKQRQDAKPFLLVVSYLEVHHQNDIDKFVAPKKYENSYRNPFVPPDLRPIPGSWPSQMGDYYGCVKGMDDCAGTLLDTLKQQGLDRDTIVLFTSDHGCHFKTRNAEYKRSAHDSSLHVPLIVQGPGFDRSLEIGELVSHINVAPSLLEAAGFKPPVEMQGASLLPLVARQAPDWRDEVYVEMSESTTGRALRTPQYTYSAAAPQRQAVSDRYTEYQLYDNYADPFQHVNLVSRADRKEISDHLRARLLARIAEAGNQARPAIEPNPLPYVC